LVFEKNVLFSPKIVKEPKIVIVTSTPDEPVLRSLDLLGGNGWIDRYVHGLVLEDVMGSSLRSPTSIVARNKEGRIVGKGF
jgi:hypothetical protein